MYPKVFPGNRRQASIIGSSGTNCPLPLLQACTTASPDTGMISVDFLYLPEEACGLREQCADEGQLARLPVRQRMPADCRQHRAMG